MKKLKLELDSLQVESFTPGSSTGEGGGGTVKGASIDVISAYFCSFGNCYTQQDIGTCYGSCAGNGSCVAACV